MIANGLIFALGALVASLAFLLFVPLLWRKAQRLARRNFEATFPTTVNEIRAESDRVRAEAALAVRRGEILAGEAREAIAKDRAEFGRMSAAHALLGEREAALVAENTQLRAELAVREDEIAEAARRALEADEAYRLRVAELEALAVGERHLESAANIEVASAPHLPANGSDDAAEQAGAASDSAFRGGSPSVPDPYDAPNEANLAGSPTGPERRLDASEEPAGESLAPLGASDTDGKALRAASIINANNRLRTAMSQQRGRPRTAKERAEIQDRIGDIAARVIHLTAEAEGPGSSLAGLVERRDETAAAGQDESAGKPMSLAERVRRLAHGASVTDPGSEMSPPVPQEGLGAAERRDGGA